MSIAVDPAPDNVSKAEETGSSTNNNANTSNNTTNNTTNDENGSNGSNNELTSNVSTSSRAGWWHSATREDCQIAEHKLVSAFVDLKKLKFEARDIKINFDARPIKLIQKEREKQKRRATQSSFSIMNLFSWDTSHVAADSPSNNATNNNANTNSAQTQFETNTINKNEETENKQQSQQSCFRSKTDSNKSNSKSKSMANINDIALETHPNMEEFIHTVSVSPSNERKTDENSNDTHIVMAHGYGCAGGVFAPSIGTFFEQISDKISENTTNNNNNNNNSTNNANNSSLETLKSPKLHIIDWLGCGLSSKPKFLCEDAFETERFFVESLEQWRVRMGIKRMILIGHSLGGYMSVVYALKYPQFIEHLILVSPVGLPEPPEDSGSLSKYPFKYRVLLSTFRSLWDKGWTPFDIVRIAGPKGKPWLENIVEKRLYMLNETEENKEHKDKLVPLLADYLYQITHTSGSGEYALNKILKPGAWAHNPLVHRITGLAQYQTDVVSSIYGVNGGNSVSSGDKSVVSGQNGQNTGSLTEEKKEEKKEDTILSSNNGNNGNNSMKIDFVYGEKDWMSSDTATMLKNENKLKCNVYEIKNSGHQMLLENSPLFAKTVANIIVNGQS